MADSADPDVEALVADVAGIFAERFGWPLAALGPAAGRAPAATVARILQALGSDEQNVGWWIAVAEDWEVCGVPYLARRSGQRARLLITGGQRASWAQLGTLAGVLRRAGRATENVEVAAPPQKLVKREGYDARRRRLAGRFRYGDRRGGQSAGVPEDRHLTDADRIAGRLLRSGVGLSVELANDWFATGEYRILVEQFLVLLSQQSIVSVRRDHLEQFVLCGRALLRMGDRASAYACFLLTDDEQTPAAMSHQRQPETVARDELLRRAADYRDSLSATAVELPRPGGAAVFTHGLQLGYWLGERNLVGLLPAAAQEGLNGALCNRPAGVLRQLVWTGGRNGWFTPHISPAATMDSLLRSARTQDVLDRVGRPGTVRRERSPDSVAGRVGALVLPDAGPDPSDPELTREGGHQRTGGERPAGRWRCVAPRPADRIADAADDPAPPPGPVIGVEEGGRDAVLRLTPGSRVAALGEPFGDDFLLELAEDLAARGWMVIHVQAQGARPPSLYSTWLHLSPDGTSHSSGRTWLQELIVLPAVRGAVERILRELLPACPDPRAGECLAALLRDLSYGRASDVYCDDEGENVRARAAEMVDIGGDLDFSRTESLRRAALLYRHMRNAIGELRGALPTQWQTPSRPGHRQVSVAVRATDPLQGSLRVAMLVGSLLDVFAREQDTSGGDAPPDTAPDGGPVPAVDDDDDFLTAPLSVTLIEERVTPDQQREIDEEARRFGGPSFPPPDPPGPAIERDHPWRDVLPATPAPVCVLVDGELDLEWSWLAAPDPRYAVVLAAAAPSDRTLRCCGDFGEFLVGALPDETAALLEVASGGTVRPALARDLGPADAVAVTPGRASARRLIVLPATVGGGMR
ncbi:hypothetical protein R8Z50_12245 [Longispora sp. K20-0274]|uniref:hypothetical protein n=1 Tax=Longispora sp. K20-0274 TaxID=3088255 RepID=UPI0039995785